MKKTTLLLILVVIVFSLFAFGCGGAKATPDLSAGKAVVESKCTTCHAIGVIEVAKYDKAGWTDTVTRMVAKGAALTADDQTKAVEYLAATYK